jgi:hypothetical protein
MRHYQLFPFNPAGRLLDAVSLDCETDGRAIGRAIDGAFPNGCELWEGFRFVGRFHGAAVKDETVSRPPVPPRVLVH